MWVNKNTNAKYSEGAGEFVEWIVSPFTSGLQYEKVGSRILILLMVFMTKCHLW